MRAHGWRRGCSRRTFVKLMAAGAAGLCLRPARANPAADTGPIARSLGESLPGVFSGDDPRRAHRILWDKPAWLAAHGGRYPAPAERVPLAVVGGGLGGLTAAYLLRRHRPVVFEQAPRFGGNARGESWRGMDYAIGAAYFTAPEAGSPLAALYAELGVDRLWHRKPEGHPAALVDARDRTSFRRHVAGRLGGRRLHPHIDTAFEHYCWSSFGASHWGKSVRRPA